MMDAFIAAMERMGAEVAAGTATYHFENDGKEYTIMRNGVAVAGISHAMADAIPGLKAAINSAWPGTDKAGLTKTNCQNRDAARRSHIENWADASDGE